MSKVRDRVLQNQTIVGCWLHLLYRLLALWSTLQTKATDCFWAGLAQYSDSGHAAILQHSVLNAALITAFLDNGTVPANPGLYTLGTAAQ